MAASILSGKLRSAINESKALVVGAGGIGCELIKNLVLSGFESLVIVDLDTIDVSNLNRQFLFQKQHVGRPKVEVARESALVFNPNASIQAIHDSILNPEYNISFFKQFSIVLNALDNKKARNHVNRLCLAAGVTLVESGSAGYLGQVTVIRKGESECYECQPKPAAKTFPGCTIRNTPSEPIHCVVWAKHLYNQLFGEADADNDVSPETALIRQEEEEEDGAEGNNDMEIEDNVGKKQEENGSSNGDNERKMGQEEEGEKKREEEQEQEVLSTRTWMEKNEYDPGKLLNKLFVADVNYLLSMDKLWKTRTPPTPLSDVEEERDGPDQEQENNNEPTMLVDQRVWSIKECIEVFLQSIPSLRQRQVNDGGGELIWDKDCNADLDFVVASANLRAHVFGIPLKSKFTIKSMAGNIIPAIATTNAVIAGLIVMEAMKELGGEFNKCKTTYLPKHPNPYKRLLVTCPLIKPNPKCYVCSPRPETTVELNTNTVTMVTLRDKVIIGHFGMVAPDVELDDGKGTILLSSEEGETDDNLHRVLSEFGVGSGSRLKVDDFLQNYQLIINLIHQDAAFEDEKEFLVISQDKLDTEDGKVEEDAIERVSIPRKRKASNSEVEESKRLRLEEENGIETLTV